MPPKYIFLGICVNLKPLFKFGHLVLYHSLRRLDFFLSFTNALETAFKKQKKSTRYMRYMPAFC